MRRPLEDFGLAGALALPGAAGADAPGMSNMLKGVGLSQESVANLPFTCFSRSVQCSKFKQFSQTSVDHVLA